MMKAGRVALLPMAGLALSSAPVLAQAAPNPAPRSESKQVICEKQEVIGSRLATRRVCKTRAEWEEQKRNDRQDLERAQTQVPVKPQ